MDEVSMPREILNQGRILIVDDETDIVTSLRDLFSANGYESVGYSSSKEALEALKEREFDMLLADLSMPEMNGIELLKTALEINPSLVGIIMTACSSVEATVEAKKAGAFDYILKPFHFSELLLIVSDAMQAHWVLESERSTTD
jgi:DNA-binding NtrC family response regulator